MFSFPFGKMFGVLFLGFIVYRIILFGGAEFTYRLTPDKINNAVSSFYFQSNIYYSLAEKALKQNDYLQAELFLLRSLKVDNSNGRAMALAINVYEELGEKEKQSEAVQLTSRLWSSHLFARSALARYWARQGDKASLLAEWNILLLQDKSFEKSLFPLILLYFEHVKTQKLLHPYVSMPPIWWNHFFSFVSKKSSNLQEINWLYEARKSSETPLMQVEYRSYIKRLVADNQWKKAFQVWNDQIKAEGRSYDSFLYDGDFEYIDTNSKKKSVFDWKILGHKHVKFDSRLAFGADKKALRITFLRDNEKVRFKHLSQTLILPEGGHYKTSYRVRTEGMKGDSNLLWRVYCFAEKLSLVAESTLITASSKWSTMSFDFNVPSTGCERQLFRLESHTLQKHNFNGRLWFDNVQVLKD